MNNTYLLSGILSKHFFVIWNHFQFCFECRHVVCTKVLVAVNGHRSRIGMHACYRIICRENKVTCKMVFCHTKSWHNLKEIWFQIYHIAQSYENELGFKYQGFVPFIKSKAIIAWKCNLRRTCNVTEKCLMIKIKAVTKRASEFQNYFVYIHEIHFPHKF